jgi:hypothetical protein
MGVSVSATNADKATAPASATDNSRNKRPVLPCMKPIGRNTATRTAVVAITAKATWRVPRAAATSLGSPRSARRWMFSSTTIASSTTSPMQSTSASSVSRLIEYPNAYSGTNAAIRHTGTVTAGISAARTLPRNSQITTSTRMIASASVWYTRSTEASMKVVVSKATKILVPSGSDGRMRSASARTARATSSALAVDVRATPRPMLGSPLLR